ncbi:MAG: hypothetical protein U1F43_23705 [Myxococcota bacterium]
MRTLVGMMALGLCAACDSAGGHGTADATTAPDDTSAGDDATTASDADATGDVGPDVGPSAATHVVTLVAGQAMQILLGGSQKLGFDVPPDTLSVTITVLGEGAPNFALNSWTGPNDNELVYAGWLGTDSGGTLCLECTNRITVEPGAFAAIAPNNPAAVLEAGHHEITLAAFTPAVVVSNATPGCGDHVCAFFDQFNCANDCAPKNYSGPVEVTVLAKVADAPGAGVPATGVLDLNLHFTGAQGLTAATAQTDAGFQAELDSMRTIYAQVGVTIGQVTYRDIDSAFRDIESIDGPDSDLQALYEQSAGNTVDGIDLYFVDTISSASLGGFGVILGIAGGIPGPPLMHGTHRSGVAIAIKPVAGAPAGVDTTMAHETGHFLGLFHTSEQALGAQQVHDPLPDTPENDESYLMFNTGSGHTLSPYQGQVMRSNPWVTNPVEE